MDIPSEPTTKNCSSALFSHIVCRQYNNFDTTQTWKIRLFSWGARWNAATLSPVCRIHLWLHPIASRFRGHHVCSLFLCIWTIVVPFHLLCLNEADYNSKIKAKKHNLYGKLMGFKQSAFVLSFISHFRASVVFQMQRCCREATANACPPS